MNHSKKKNNKYRNKKNIDHDFAQDDHKVVSLRSVCPDRIQLPLKYSQNGTLGGSITVDQVFNLNSLFDPDRTGAGHQPLGFDQWSAFYNRYRVDKVKVVVDLLPLNSIYTDVVIQASNDATALSTLATVLSAVESPFSKAFMMSGNNTMVRHFQKTYDLAAITGVTRSKYITDDIYAATTGASPTEILALHLCAQDMAFASNVLVQYRITLTFLATMWDRNELAES
jgi:hypothetical protein